MFLEFFFNNFSEEKENPTFPPCFSSALPFNLISACLHDVSIRLGLHFLFRHTLPSLHFGFFKFSTFRMVGDEDDEGALSDSDGKGGLAADDLASK